MKRNANGAVPKHKPRLVAKGFHQQEGFDYSEKFSPVVKPATIKTIISLSISKGWLLHRIDINNAFLNGELQEEVYMSQPPGFVQGDGSLVCKLHKAIYGLKQAPRSWFTKLHNTLLAMGFHSARTDCSLFIKHTATHTILVLVYVDDYIITSDSFHLIQDLISSLHSIFPLKDLGPLHYFLGIQIHQTKHVGLHLSQTNYINDLLLKANMLLPDLCLLQLPQE